MRLLIIGGSVFLGRALVAAARTHGHEITLFNRGVSSSAPDADVTLIKGDRNGDLSALAGKTWDAVIDTCGYFPRQVRSLLGALAGRIGHYTFVSTVSAYADLSRPGLTESAELGRLADETIETVTIQTYGPLKALCEAAAQQAIPETTLLVRPGIIVGPHDPTDRFAYWVSRIAAGDEVLAPGNPKAAVQLIDARDLAAWIIAMVEAGKTGVFNTVGPKEPLTLQSLFATCAEAVSPAARFAWVNDAFLVQRGIGDWMQLPLYIPGRETKYAGMFAINGAKAFAHGLKLRAIGQTATDTWQWIQTRQGGGVMKTGLSREQERALIDAWTAAG